MYTFFKRSMIVASIGFMTMVVMVANCYANRDSPDVSAVRALLKADNALDMAIFKAELEEEKKRLRGERAAKLKQLPRDLMELAEKYPNTTGGLAALYWAAFILQRLPPHNPHLNSSKSKPPRRTWESWPPRPPLEEGATTNLAEI